MARIAGVEIPSNKKILYSLCYIYGVGLTVAKNILGNVGIDKDIRAKDLTEEQISKINDYISKNLVVEGALKRVIAQNIQRLKDIGSYRGSRHQKGLPVRGQRTRTNARTRKGPRKTVAGKKEAVKPT